MGTCFDLHDLHRLGGLRKFFSWKKICSPAVKRKSVPQSAQVKTLS